MVTPPPKIPSMFEMLLAQAASAANQEPPRTWPMNPFPRGVREGSVTDKVLTELRRVAPRALEHGHLRMRLNAGRGAVSWATAFLIHMGEIEQLSDPRSPMYRKYKLRRKDHEE